MDHDLSDVNGDVTRWTSSSAPRNHPYKDHLGYGLITRLDN